MPVRTHKQTLPGPRISYQLRCGKLAGCQLQNLADELLSMANSVCVQGCVPQPQLCIPSLLAPCTVIVSVMVLVHDRLVGLRHTCRASLCRPSVPSGMLPEGDTRSGTCHAAALCVGSKGFTVTVSLAQALSMPPASLLPAAYGPTVTAITPP